MVLGFSEDFTSEVVLDSQLRATPDSGLFVNSGVDPSITLQNLLDHLPKVSFTFSAWSNSTAYGVFLDSRDKKDIVVQSNKIFESIKSGTDHDPEEVDSEYWVETNIESLRLKIFLRTVMDRVNSDLGLTRRLVNNQYIYDSGARTFTKTLPNDYSAIVIEPKGSDYVDFRINEMCFRKSGSTPVNMYVVNEGNLVGTYTLTPDEGRNTFTATNIVLSGKGRFYLVIDSTDVVSSNASIDPFKFKGFTVYMASGTGVSAQAATYERHTSSNGMGINITAYLNPTKFIDNTVSEMAPFIRATFEYMAFRAFLSNPNQRSNRSERMIPEEGVLLAELKSFDGDTVVRRYSNHKKQAMKLVDRAFDNDISEKRSGIDVTVGSV